MSKMRTINIAVELPEDEVLAGIWDHARVMIESRGNMPYGTQCKEIYLDDLAQQRKIPEKVMSVDALEALLTLTGAFFDEKQADIADKPGIVQANHRVDLQLEFMKKYCGYVEII